MAAVSEDNLSTLDEEVRQVKEKYGKECRVITDVGDFKYVINIRPADVDISVKFQLTGNYPVEKAGVIVRSNTIATDCIPEIQEIINKNMIQKQGTSAIDTTMQAILTYLKDNGLDVAPEQPHENKKSKGKQKKKKSVKAKEKQVTEEENEKKSSMKTAEDVIKRIQWDENLSSECFLVGYIDRFKGIQEKGFSAFSWEDISSVDYNTLAIPKHRIQYFKFKEVTIWDKNRRLDNMFGSTGSGVTIHDVIEHYDDYKVKEEPVKKSSGVKSGSKKHVVEDESEDDIEIDLGSHGAPRNSNFTDDLNDSDGQDRLRPSHFLCVKITDPEIKNGVEAMQDSILEVETRYASCCTRPGELHVTLCTLGLYTVEQIADACRVLEESQLEIAELATQDLAITVEGVDNFYNRVIYAKIQHDKPLMDFADHMKNLMKESGIDITDNYGYVPHLTIMKITRPVAREMRTKTIHRSIYQHFGEKINMYFGKQKVDKVYLCEMSGDRGDDGFYVTPTSIDLNEEM